MEHSVARRNAPPAQPAHPEPFVRHASSYRRLLAFLERRTEVPEAPTTRGEDAR
jgi:hypothetical protein